MGYRGRLLHPLLVEIAQLDTDATTQAGGFDRNWRTVKTSYPSGVRTRGQVYKSETLKLRAQVEPGQDNQQQRTIAGNVPDTKFTLVFHYAELESLGLIDPDGLPLVRVNDKWIALYRLDGSLIRNIDPALYATELLDTGLGLGGERNLCAITFEDRPQGMTA